jgi:predicted Zn-dependent protease
MGIHPPASQPAAPAATVTVTTGQAPKSGSNKGVIIGALAVAVVGGVAFMSMGGKKEPQAAKVAESAVTAPAAPAEVKEVLSSKDHLNQLLGLARDSRWKEVPAKIALLKSMTQVTKASSPQSKQLADQGQELLGSDQYDKAAEVFEKAVQADPSNHQARFGLGASLTRLGKFDSALTVLIDGLLIAPDEGRGWLTAAEAFSELGKSEAASSALKLAYYFASNRENAKKFLEDPSRTKSDKFRKVIDTVLPALSGVPAKS